MKVLFLTHPEADYGAGMLFNGMCELIGAENVYDFPAKLSYHGLVHEYARPWENGSMGLTGPLPWMSPWPIAFEDKRYVNAESEVTSKLANKEFDIVIVESPRHQSVGTFERLKSCIADSGAAIVLHDGEDYPGINTKALRCVNPHVFLKREQTMAPYIKNDTCFACFPFSSADKVISDIVGTNEVSTEFDYTVSFMCGNSYPERQRVADVLRDSFGSSAMVAISPDDRNTGQELLSWESYLKTMHRSKVAVNVRGYGYDTVRFWETAILTLLVTDNTPLVYTDMYKDRETFRLFTDHTNVVSVINELLENEEELSALRKRCVAHTRKYHTNLARAKYLVALLTEQGAL